MADNKKTKTRTPTQSYVEIAEIHDDTVILRNNSLLAVLLVSSINFALKSEEEQNAIIQGYISFINALDFPIQIVVQSRKLDIRRYLQSLKNKEKEQTNELLKIQISEYSQYIKELVEMGDIVSKRFYIVVPYNPLSGTRKQGAIGRMLSSFQAVDLINIKKEQFIKYGQELDRRIAVVQGNLASMMINSERLDTQSLIELYYNTYNPETSGRESISEVDKLRVN